MARAEIPSSRNLKMQKQLPRGRNKRRPLIEEITERVFATRKRRRVQPLDEGHLKKILDLFFMPLCKYRAEDDTMKSFFEKLFDVDRRTITRYTSLNDFDLPGLYKMLPSKPIQGFGYRGIRSGMHLFVRMDAADPERIEIEVHNGQGKKEQVFQLSPAEWRRIKRHLV